MIQIKFTNLPATICAILLSMSCTSLMANESAAPNINDIQKAVEDRFSEPGYQKFKITEILGCKEAADKPGYFCDYTYTTNNNPKNQIDTDRFVKTPKGWILIPNT